MKGNPNPVPISYRRHERQEWLTLGSVGTLAAERWVARLMAVFPGEYVAGPKRYRYVRGLFLTRTPAEASAVG